MGPPAVAAERRTQATFLAGLRNALVRDFCEDELSVACKIGVLLAAGHRPGEIRTQLGVTPKAMQEAKTRLERTAPRLDSVRIDEVP